MRAVQIVLASASPRRKMLLEAIGLEVQVRPVDIDESPVENEGPEALAERLAGEKADAALPGEGEVVITADTVVALGGKLFGKPKDDKEAADFLRLLSGKTHRVCTGWCVAGPDKRLCGVTTTLVSFRTLNEHEIASYVKTQEPLDKAGAYGIQSGGGAMVDRIEGSYPNVVGLPVAEVMQALSALGSPK